MCGNHSLTETTKYKILCVLFLHSFLKWCCICCSWFYSCILEENPDDLALSVPYLLLKHKNGLIQKILMFSFDGYTYCAVYSPLSTIQRRDRCCCLPSGLKMDAASCSPALIVSFLFWPCLLLHLFVRFAPHAVASVKLLPWWVLYCRPTLWTQQTSS